MGYALYLAEIGERSPRAKIFKGIGNAKVWEVKENAPSGTYRTVYLVEFKEYVFVLHAFQKKSKSGIATDKKDVDLIHRRLKEAKDAYTRLCTFFRTAWLVYLPAAVRSKVELGD